MSIWTRLYQHSNFRGRSLFANLYYTSPPKTYLYIPKPWLDNSNLHDRISSLKIGCSSWEEGGKVILFEHSNLRGRYVMFSANPGTIVEIPSISAYNFNDITSSALIIRQFETELGPLAIGSLGNPPLRTQIEDVVSEVPKVELRGSPIITWNLWPSFSPSRKYIYIRVPIKVDISWWPDYDAELRFWIYLYIDRNKKVRGFVNFYGAWVEGGILTGKILNQLMEEIPKHLGKINQKIANAISILHIFDFVGLYYLPGTATQTGHVENDVSVVLVKEW